MAGVFAGIGAIFDVGPLVRVAEASRWLLPSDGLWRGTIWALEPTILAGVAENRVGPAAAANPFFASTPPPVVFDLWAAGWIVLVLALGCWSLARRDT